MIAALWRKTWCWAPRDYLGEYCSPEACTSVDLSHKSLRSELCTPHTHTRCTLYAILYHPPNWEIEIIMSHGEGLTSSKTGLCTHPCYRHQENGARSAPLSTPSLLLPSLSLYESRSSVSTTAVVATQDPWRRLPTKAEAACRRPQSFLRIRIACQCDLRTLLQHLSDPNQTGRRTPAQF